MQRQSSYLLLIWLVAIHALYFAAALWFKGFFLIDSYGYAMQADNMATNGSWYAEDWNAPLLVDYFSIRPPLYAAFIVFFRLFSHSVIPLLLFQNTLSIITCMLVSSFLPKAGLSSPITKRMLIVTLLLYPAQMIHAGFVMTEILFQFLLLCLFLAVYAFMHKPRNRTSLLISVLLSLCLLTKPVSLFLPMLVWVFMLVSIIKRQGNGVKLILQLLVVLTFHCICLQNKHATGYYHYTSIKSINQLKYNARYTLIAAEGEIFADSVITGVMQKADAAENYGERLSIMDDAAVSIIRQYPVAFAKVYVKGVIAFFIDPGRFDVFHFFAIEEKGTLGLMHEMQTKGIGAIGEYIQRSPPGVLILLLLSLLWNIAVIVLMIYFLVRIQSKLLRNMIFVFVAYIALATGPVGVSRYRVPVFPFLLIGILGASHLYVQHKQSSHA